MEAIQGHTTQTVRTPEWILDTATKRIVETHRPKRIILFGSRAWGSPDEDSDFDLLVVVPDDAILAQVASEIRWALRDLPASFDILVRSQTLWQKWSSVSVTVEHRIACGGRVVYDAGA